jgi:hypothetical protein
MSLHSTTLNYKNTLFKLINNEERRVVYTLTLGYIFTLLM